MNPFGMLVATTNSIYQAYFNQNLPTYFDFGCIVFIENKSSFVFVHLVSSLLKLKISRNEEFYSLMTAYFNQMEVKKRD